MPLFQRLLSFQKLVIGRSWSAPPNLLMYIPSVTAYALKPVGLPPRARYLQITKPAATNASSWPGSVSEGNASLTGATQPPLGSFSRLHPTTCGHPQRFLQKGSAGLSKLLGNLHLYLSLFLWQLLIIVRTTPCAKSIFSFSVEL